MIRISKGYNCLPKKVQQTQTDILLKMFFKIQYISYLQDPQNQLYSNTVARTSYKKDSTDIRKNIKKMLYRNKPNKI